MKTCYFCKGEIKAERIDFMAKKEGRYVLIKDVPAEVCQQCGESFFDLTSSQIIDDAIIKAESSDQIIQVPVVEAG